MHPEEFHAQVDQAKLAAALAHAERTTHGRIYVYVSHRPIVDPLATGRRRFEKLGLSKFHDHHPTVLIYLAPKTHKFAIIGNEAIHARCGDDLWKKLADELSTNLKKGEITPALLNTISSLTQVLTKHFPAT